LVSLPARHRSFASTALLAVATLAGCAGQSVISDGLWREGVERNQAFTRVLVVGVSPNINQRCAFEQDLAQHQPALRLRAGPGGQPAQRDRGRALQLQRAGGREGAVDA